MAANLLLKSKKKKEKTKLKTKSSKKTQKKQEMKQRKISLAAEIVFFLVAGELMIFKHAN